MPKVPDDLNVASTSPPFPRDREDTDTSASTAESDLTVRPFSPGFTAKMPTPDETMTEAIPRAIPSAPMATFGGFSLAHWRIRRVAAARELIRLWTEAQTQQDLGAFSVHCQGFVQSLKRHSSLFADVPGQDLFCSFLYLLQNALSGDNFDRVYQRRLCHVIEQALATCLAADLTLEDYDATLALLDANGLAAW